MKNRRIVIVAFMLIAALCLGIGYANVADELNVNGQLSVNEANFEEAFEAAVQFVDISATAPATKNSAPLASGLTAVVEGSAPNENDTFTVTIDNTVFTTEADEVKIYVGVKNDTVQTAVNVEIVPDADPALSMFTLGMVAEDGNTTIAAGDTETYVITITLDSIPAATVTNATFTFTLTATPIN